MTLTIILIIMIINLIKINTMIIEMIIILWKQMLMLWKHVRFIKTLHHLVISFLSFINIARINIRCIKIVFIFYRFNHNVHSFMMKHFKILMRHFCKIISIEVSIKIFIKQINSFNHYQINVFKAFFHQQIQTRTLINVHHFVFLIISTINFSRVIFSSQFNMFIIIK